MRVRRGGAGGGGGGGTGCIQNENPHIEEWWEKAVSNTKLWDSVVAVPTCTEHSASFVALSSIVTRHETMLGAQG